MRSLNWVVALVGLIACGDSTGTTDSDAPPPPTPCDDDVVSSEATVHATVVEVDWETTAGVTTWIEWGLDGAFDRVTAPVDGPSNTAWLVGAYNGADLSWRVASDLGACGTHSGELPGDGFVPEQGAVRVDVTHNDPALHDGGYLVGANVATTAFAWAIDREGNNVWSKVLDGDRLMTDAKPSILHDGIVYNSFAEDRTKDESVAIAVNWGGEQLESTATATGHHAFKELPNGDVAYLGIDIRDVDGSPWVGDTLNIIHSGGTETQIWNVWDHPDQIQTEDLGEDIGFYPQGFDWTHANGFDYDEENDRWLITFRNVATVLELDNAGTEVMSFGAMGSWTLDGIDVADIKWPHNAHYTPEGNVLVFVTPGGDSGTSTLVELARDDVAKTMTVVWEHPCQLSGGGGCSSRVEGAGERLANGNTIVSWGAAGVLQEVTEGHAIAWEAKWPLGHITGHVHQVDSLP